MILNEASNMSTEDKMRAWAQGTRKENIKACSENKLSDFANTLGNLAIQEANKNNASLARALTDKLLDIADVHQTRGNTYEEKTVRAAYQRISGQVDNILKAKDTAYQFAKQAYEVYKKMLNDTRSEFDSMVQTIDVIDGNLILKPAYNSIEDIVEKIYTIDEDRFYQDYVLSHRFLDSVINKDYCRTSDTSNPDCNYTDYARRIYATNYLVALLSTQLLLFGRKAMLKYQPKVSCYVNNYLLSGCFNIKLYIAFGSAQRDVACFEFKLYYGDLRSASLSDLLDQNIAAEYTYTIFDDKIKNTDTTFVKNLVNNIKEFRTKLYNYLNTQ